MATLEKYRDAEYEEKKQKEQEQLKEKDRDKEKKSNEFSAKEVFKCFYSVLKILMCL